MHLLENFAATLDEDWRQRFSDVSHNDMSVTPSHLVQDASPARSTTASTPASPARSTTISSASPARPVTASNASSARETTVSGPLSTADAKEALRQDGL